MIEEETGFLRNNLNSGSYGFAPLPPLDSTNNCATVSPTLEHRVLWKMNVNTKLIVFCNPEKIVCA